MNLVQKHVCWSFDRNKTVRGNYHLSFPQAFLNKYDIYGVILRLLILLLLWLLQLLLLLLLIYLIIISTATIIIILMIKRRLIMISNQQTEIVQKYKT